MVRSSTMLVLPSALLVASTVHAHVALWDKGMFGYNYPFKSTDTVNHDYNTNDPVVPLRAFNNLTLDQWWGHGRRDFPPIPGDFLELPAGGVLHGELACNRADSKLRDPVRTDPQPNFACGGIGALHVVNNTFESTGPVNASAFGGTALAIAYTSNWTTVQPGDMTVISVNYTSPWWRLTDYSIPADLPPCPDGGCICTWNWVHLGNHGEGDPTEIYNVMYRCKVTNPATGRGLIVGSPTVPTMCEDNASRCIPGSKQPLYVYQKTGNNLPATSDPPTYNARYGFNNGAQEGIFVAGTMSYTTTSTATATSITTGSSGVPNTPSSASPASSSRTSSGGPACQSPWIWASSVALGAALFSTFGR